jgi:hypothetical protein
MIGTLVVVSFFVIIAIAAWNISKNKSNSSGGTYGSGGSGDEPTTKTPEPM